MNHAAEHSAVGRHATGMRRVELLRAELTCKGRLYSCSIDIEGARELLERREYAGPCVN